MYHNEIYNCIEFYDYGKYFTKKCPKRMYFRNFLSCLEKWLDESGTKDEFIESMVLSTPYSKNLCTVGKLLFKLGVSESDNMLYCSSYAYVAIYVLDCGEHYLASKNIDAKNLMPELERVIDVACKFVMTDDTQKKEYYGMSEFKCLAETEGAKNES